MRFTALRRRVLELIWDGHRPMKAYDLLERLQGERTGAAPPTVYRTLDFLLREGLIHRVESLNAYVGCAHPGHGVQEQLLVCGVCGVVAEVVDCEVEVALQRQAEEIGFCVVRAVVEVVGICPRCRA